MNHFFQKNIFLKDAEKAFNFLKKFKVSFFQKIKNYYIIKYFKQSKFFNDSNNFSILTKKNIAIQFAAAITSKYWKYLIF